jgi:MoxR-like ATPase
VNTSLEQLSQIVQDENKKFLAVQQEVSKVIVGQTEMVESLLLALLSDGHILLEGLPGLAKTLAVTTLAKILRCDFKRVQFTPDLLPADLIGTTYYNPKEGTFAVNKGPIFTDILLADEINRAPAKVQSALLEIMQEHQVTIGGQTFKTGNPYLVLATQNPIEQEGTYLLPEAQTDRFMFKVKVEYPSFEEEKQILERMGRLSLKFEPNPILEGSEILHARQIVNEIYIDPKIIDYILRIVFATRQPKEYGVDIEGLLLFGASPRATLALKIAGKAHAFLAGRAFVTPHDIKKIAYRILRHRLRRSYEAEAEDLSADDIIDRILSTLPTP